MTEDADKLDNCHTKPTIARCNHCGTVTTFLNRCDQFFCPCCQPRLARERQDQVRWWTIGLKQPKHVVLTVKNIPDLTSGHVDELRAWFTKLRRTKFASNWTAGFYSIEVTKEGKHWHLHIHALIEAKWIDAAGLALKWASITHSLGRIVKVKDCRDQTYLAEVLKYAVKGNQLAAWEPHAIGEFINAFRHKRTFAVFGTLYGARTEFAEWIATLKSCKAKCDCGSNDITYFTEAEWLAHDLQPHQNHAPRPPPKDHDQEFLPLKTQTWPD